jgi:hypothetical protein
MEGRLGKVNEKFWNNGVNMIVKKRNFLKINKNNGGKKMLIQGNMVNTRRFFKNL